MAKCCRILLLISEILLPMLSSRIFMISWLIFKSFIHFEFFLVYGASGWAGFILLHIPVQFFNTIYQRGYFYSIVRSWPLCQILIDHRDMGLFLAFLFCFIDLCLFLCQYQAVLIIVALYYRLILALVIPPTLFFLFKFTEAIQGLFWCCINFWNICSRSVKYAIGILIWIALNL